MQSLTTPERGSLAEALAITADQLTGMTPPEIDAIADRLALFQADQNEKAARAISGLRYYLKEKQQQVGRRKVWPTSDRQAEEKARALHGAETLFPWDQRSLGQALDSLDAARAAWDTAKGPNAELSTEWDRRGGWSRFWLVSNTNGHIHSSTHCQTCFPTTRYQWLTSMSGRTEADTVAEHGTRLCSVCFPTAPVEWTLGVERPDDACDGTDKPPVGEVRRNYSGAYGKCSGCGDSRKLKASGRLPRHKPKKK